MNIVEWYVIGKLMFGAFACGAIVGGGIVLWGERYLQQKKENRQ